MNCCGNRRPIPLGEERRAEEILLSIRVGRDLTPVKHCNICTAEHFHSYHAFRLEQEDDDFSVSAMWHGSTPPPPQPQFRNYGIQEHARDRLEREFARVADIDETIRGIYAPMDYETKIPKKTKKPEPPYVSPWNP